MKKTIITGVLAFVAGAVVGTKYGNQAAQWVATKYAEAKEKYGKKDNTDGFESPTEQQIQNSAVREVQGIKSTLYLFYYSGYEEIEECDNKTVNLASG